MARYARTTTCAIGAAAALILLDAAGARARQKALAGPVVLITGGSRGFGLALARQFGSLRCRLAVCARDPQELARAQQTLEHAGYEVVAFTCDISDRDGAAAMVNGVSRHYGHIDILLNNAGEILVSPLENLTIADFERAMAVMFWGPSHNAGGTSIDDSTLPGRDLEGRHGSLYRLLTTLGKRAGPAAESAGSTVATARLVCIDWPRAL
jgi:NAD(P)-dependent dehydrogenase (short-subunit alcohol dehydrogenase family)